MANNGRDEDCFEGDLVLVPQKAPPNAPETNTDTPVKPPLFASRPNVLLITVDTLRADHLGAYGYTFDISPNIDALASESTLFLRARAQGSMTRYSIPSMMTGRYVSELARNRKAWTKIMDENLVLGEVLAASGIRPFAVHAIAYLHPRYGMSQGFETYDMTPVQKRGTNFTQATDDLVTDRALHHLDESLLKTPKTPWFLWAYYGDPHAGYVRHKSVPFKRRGMKGMYDHEISFTDQQIGRLVDGLKKRGVYDNTLIIFTSDHGEGLDEKEDHGVLYHGDTLYDNVLHVPFFVRVPKQPARKVPTVVGNIDLFPTLVEILDLTLPPDTILHGTSLVPWLRGETPKHPPVFSEKAISYGPPLKAMIDWPWKVIWNTSFGRFQLYNIEDDPGERKNLARSHPKELERLKRAFQVWRSTTLREVKAVP